MNSLTKYSFAVSSFVFVGSRSLSIDISYSMYLRKSSKGLSPSLESIFIIATLIRNAAYFFLVEQTPLLQVFVLGSTFPESSARYQPF